MYSKSFRPAQKRTEGDVPVQYFGDSFSADAFNSMHYSKGATHTERADTCCDKAAESEKEPKTDNKTNAPTKAARSFDIEDLLLIGLVLLFTTDINNKEDLIVPVVLAAILLF